MAKNSFGMPNTPDSNFSCIKGNLKHLFKTVRTSITAILLNYLLLSQNVSTLMMIWQQKYNSRVFTTFGIAFSRYLKVSRCKSLHGSFPKFTEHKCQTRVFTSCQSLTAIPLGKSITVRTPFIYSKVSPVVFTLTIKVLVISFTQFMFIANSNNRYFRVVKYFLMWKSMQKF